MPPFSLSDSVLPEIISSMIHSPQFFPNLSVWRDEELHQRICISDIVKNLSYSFIFPHYSLYLPIHRRNNITISALIPIQRFGMPDKQIAARTGIIIKSFYQRLFRNSVKINHHISAKYNMKFLLKRKVRIHQIESPKGYFFFYRIFNCPQIFIQFLKIFSFQIFRQNFHPFFGINALFGRFQNLV